MVQQDGRHLWSTGTQVRSPAQDSGLKDLALPQQWHRLQLLLESEPRPRNSICCQVAKKEGKKKKRKRKERKEIAVQAVAGWGRGAPRG